MLNWVKTPIGIVIGVAFAVLLVFGLFKGQSIWDNYLGNRHTAKVASADAHADTASVDIVKADSVHAQGIILRRDYATLKKQRRVISDPIALEVIASADKVIAKADSEVVDVRAANTQLQRESHDLRTAGEARIPRLIPYVDIYERYKVDSTGAASRASLGLRIGLNYRVVNHFNAMVELSKEPKYVGRVGAHITFR